MIPVIGLLLVMLIGFGNLAFRQARPIAPPDTVNLESRLEAVEQKTLNLEERVDAVSVCRCPM